MKMFVNIKIESDCCQSFGVCGEQFSLDIIFDDFGAVTSTRFRFQHTTQKSQQDYIDGLVETRRVTDVYAKQLIPNDKTEVLTEAKYYDRHPQYENLLTKAARYMGIDIHP